MKNCIALKEEKKVYTAKKGAVTFCKKNGKTECWLRDSGRNVRHKERPMGFMKEKIKETKKTSSAQ